MPEVRTTLALSVKEPLVAVQDEPVGGGVELTVTVAD